MKRWAVIVVVAAATSCSSSGSIVAPPPVSRPPVSIPAGDVDPTPPAGWSQVLYDVGDRAGVTTDGFRSPAGGSQVEVVLQVTGDVQRAGACLLNVTYGDQTCSSEVTATASRPGRIYLPLSNASASVVQVAVDFAGAGTWRVWVFRQH